MGGGELPTTRFFTEDEKMCEIARGHRGTGKTVGVHQRGHPRWVGLGKAPGKGRGGWSKTTKQKPRESRQFFLKGMAMQNNN